MANAQVKPASVKTEVAVKKEAPLPSIMDLEASAGQGSEYVTARDTKLPILKILYASSEVLDESSGKYNANAKQGDIYNETTGNLYKGKDGIIVVPCLYINTFNEWKDRGDSKGRPVGIHLDPAVMRDTKRGEDNKDRLPNGNYIEPTHYHFILTVGEDEQPGETAVIVMKSTQAKKSKKWNSMMLSQRRKGEKGFFQPPTWSQIYTLRTVLEKNNLGSWYGWEVDHVKDIPNANLMKAAQSFYDTCRKGMAKVNLSQDETTETEKSPF